MGIQEVSTIKMLRGGGCCFCKPSRHVQNTENKTVINNNIIQINEVRIVKVIQKEVVNDGKKIIEQNNQRLIKMFKQLIEEQFGNNLSEIKKMIGNLQQSCQNQIRCINQYEQIITIEQQNQYQENLLNYLKSLQGVMNLSQIQAHQLIQLCLTIIIEIYKCQVKDKNAILEQQYSEQYQNLIQEIKSSNEKCQMLQYDVQILEIGIQNCRKEIQKEIQIKEDLLIYQSQVDILNIFQEHQYLFNFNYESNQQSIQHFELYCFYQMIQKKVIYQIQDENQETITNISQMLQQIYIYQFKDKKNLIFHRHWIQLIFELLILSKQVQESDSNTSAQQIKIQDLSYNLMQVYLRFYAQLKIKDDPILPQQIQAYLDPNIKYVKTLSAALSISAQNVKKILVAIGDQEIEREKNFLNQQINLICQLKNEYFKFIGLEHNIYQVTKMVIQKSDLIRSLQTTTNEQIETLDRLTIDDLKFFDNFKECNSKLISSIIKLEQQVTNNTVEQQTIDQRQAIENDLIEINQFINNIQELFFKLEQNNEQQHFLIQNQFFLQKLMQNTRYSLKQDNQEDNYEQQEVQINITLKYALEIILSMLNDKTNQQFYFQIIENNKMILPQKEQASQIEDLNETQLRCFQLEISIQSLKVYQIQRGKQIEQIIQTMNKIYHTDARSLQDILNHQNQRITDIFSRLNYIGITKLKQQFKRLHYEIQEDKYYVLNSYATNILKQNFVDLNTQILQEIDAIISFQGIIQQENDEYVENDYLRERRIKLRDLLSNANQQVKFETTTPEDFKKMNQEKWLTLEQLFKKEQLDIKQQIKNLRYITQILRQIIQSLANNISTFTNSNDQSLKNRILRQGLYQIQKQIEDSDLKNLITEIHRDKNINPNIIQYFNQKISKDEFNQFDQIYQNKKFLIQNIEYDNLNCSKRINHQRPISTINIFIIDYFLLYGRSIMENNKIALKYISNKFFQLWIYEIDSTTRNHLIIDEIVWEKTSSDLLTNNPQEMFIQLLQKLKDQQNSLKQVNELDYKINILRQLFIITQNTIQMLNYQKRDDIEFGKFQEDIINEIRKLQGKKYCKPIPQEKNHQREDSKQQLLQYKQSRQTSIQKRERELNSIQIKQRFKVKKYIEDNKAKIQIEYKHQDILYQNPKCQNLGEINEFISNQQLQVLLLLGLEGSGKTSELINLENKLWEQFNPDNESKQNWIPIYISFSQIIDQFKVFLHKQMNQIFNSQIFLEQFINSVNEERQRVLFLIDNIDDIKIEVLKNNFIKLFFEVLGLKQQCFGSSLKFIVSARSKFQTYQNYQLFFSGTRIDSILEIELLPFDDEQRKQYFILNNKRNAKQILFKYYSSQYEIKQLNTQQFEECWKQFENYFDKEKQQEIKDIKQIQLFKDLSYQQQVNLEKDLLNLKNSTYFLKLIKEQNIQQLTQTAFQLELFTYVYPLLIKQFNQFFIIQQIRKQYYKLKKKSAKNRNKITNENSFLDSVSGIASLNGTQYFQDNNKIDEIIKKLKQQGFIKNYQRFINLEGNQNRIIMGDQVYQINDCQIIVEALRAKKLTSYQIIELYVNSLNKKYFQNLEKMCKIHDFEIALEQIDQFYQQLAINLTLNNQQYQINVSILNEEETLFINTDLISIQENSYSFKNKIIQEFYVAKYIYQNLTNEIFLHQIENSQINRESFNLTFNNLTGVVNILREQLCLYDGIEQNLVNLIKRSENSRFIRVSSNCIFLISILNLSIERVSLQSISISDTNISGISFLDSNLSKSKFNNVIMNNCNFDSAILNDVIWDNIQIREVGHLPQCEPVEQVMFSPNGSLLVSLNLMLIKIWDFKTLQLRYKNQIVNNCFNQMAISHDSQLLATYTNDQLILIELVRFEKIKTIRLHSKPISLIDFSSDNEVVGIIDSKGSLMYCQCTDSSTQIREKQIGHNKINDARSLNKFVFAKDKRYFLFKGIQRAIELFDILSENKSPLEKFDADQFIVSSNGSLAISFNNNLFIYSWIDNNYKKQFQINFFQQIVNLSSYNINQTIYLQFKDSVIIWNSQDQFLQGIYKNQGVEKFCIHPNGNILACWKKNKSNFKLCDLDAINPIANYQIFDSNIVKAEYSLEGSLIIVQLSQKIVFWDFIKMECQRILDDKTNFCISQEGTFLAATTPQGIEIWKCCNIYNQLDYFLIEEIYNIQKIFFSNESKKLAVITYNQEILKFWDINSNFESQKSSKSFNIESEKIICIAISPTNSTLAYVCNTNNSIIQIYDKKTYITKQLKGHGKQISSIDYSKNGKLLASRSLDRSIKVWFLDQAGSISISLPIQHNLQLLNNQHCCVWIPNDQLILASNQENKIILWELYYTNSDELKRDEIMFNIDKSNNGKQFPTYSMSEIVDSQCIGQECLYITFSPNGKYIASLYMNLNNQSIISNQHSQQVINPQIIVWDFNTKKKLMAIQISQWQKISFLSDSSSIVYHHYDQNQKTNLIKIHPITQDLEQKPIEFVIGCQYPFQYVIFSPQTNYFLAFKQESYSVDHVLLYSFDNQQQPKLFNYFQLKSESAFSFTPDGQQLVYSSQKKIQFFQILDSSQKIRNIRILNLNSYGLKLNSLILNKDSDLIGFSIIQKKLIIFSECETIQLSNKHFEFEIKSVYFQDKMILCGKQNDQGIIKIFDISNKENIILDKQVQNQQKVCNILYFDNKRNILAIQDDEFLIKIYNLIDEQQYQCKYQIEQKLEMSTICFSSNDIDILAVSIKGKMFLYNINNQKNQENNTCPKLQLLKTLPNNFLIQAKNCKINNAQINSRFNSLLELFKYQGAKDQ